MNVITAHALAQLLSLAVFALIGAWYVAPWIAARQRADALIPLVWVHAFRYIALQVFSAQKAGFPISDGGRDQILYGDLTGAAVALAAIIALRYRSRLAIPLVFLLIAETAADTVLNVGFVGVPEHLFEAANGVTWLVTAFYVPVIIVSLVLLGWQLFTRRGEPLADDARSRMERRMEPAARAVQFGR